MLLPVPNAGHEHATCRSEECAGSTACRKNHDKRVIPEHVARPSATVPTSSPRAAEITKPVVPTTFATTADTATGTIVTTRAASSLRLQAHRSPQVLHPPVHKAGAGAPS
jgi:hypothetical protein